MFSALVAHLLWGTATFRRKKPCLSTGELFTIVYIAFRFSKIKLVTKLDASGIDDMKKAYLVAYNLAQFAGWTYLGWLLAPHLLHLIRTGKPSPGTYDDCSLVLRICQIGGYMEFFHNVLGLVRSSPLLTLMQITSRVVLVVITDLITDGRSSAPYTTMLAAWTLAETVRYLSYALGILEVKFYPLTWLRYTTFILNYPFGVSSELLVFYYSWNAIKQTSFMKLTMPNAFNVTFNLETALMCYILLYVPIFPKLYGHMISQRKKVIGGESKKQN